jgi:hypothetical protein
MLERLHCQLHEPGDQKGKGIGKKKKQCSAGVSPAERDYIRNESGKVFDGWILNGCSGVAEILHLPLATMNPSYQQSHFTAKLNQRDTIMKHLNALDVVS